MEIVYVLYVNRVYKQLLWQWHRQGDEISTGWIDIGFIKFSHLLLTEL